MIGKWNDHMVPITFFTELPSMTSQITANLPHVNPVAS